MDSSSNPFRVLINPRATVARPVLLSPTSEGRFAALFAPFEVNHSQRYQATISSGTPVSVWFSKASLTLEKSTEGETLNVPWWTVSQIRLSKLTSRSVTFQLTDNATVRSNVEFRAFGFDSHGRLQLTDFARREHFVNHFQGMNLCHKVENKWNKRVYYLWAWAPLVDYDYD